MHIHTYFHNILILSFAWLDQYERWVDEMRITRTSVLTGSPTLCSITRREIKKLIALRNKLNRCPRRTLWKRFLNKTTWKGSLTLIVGWALQSTHGFMLKMSLMSSCVVPPRGLAASPSHFSVQVLWICSPGLCASSPGVSVVDGVAGLAGVVLSWMSWTWGGVDTGEDFDYKTGGKRGGMWIYVHVKIWKFDRAMVEVEMLECR